MRLQEIGLKSKVCSPLKLDGGISTKFRSAFPVSLTHSSIPTTQQARCLSQMQEYALHACYRCTLAILTLVCRTCPKCSGWVPSAFPRKRRLA